ncbi:MAG: F0F1 ATP synthase subunit B [Acidimicrobiales bacterium]
MLVASSSGTGASFIVPNATFVVELAIFVVVLGLMAKFVLPSLHGVLDERRAVIVGAQRDAEAARQEARRLDAERAAVLAKARAEARALIDEAAGSVEDLIEDARARGQAELERRLAAATDVIESERRHVYDVVMEGAVELVIEAAARIVGGNLDAERHRVTIAADLAAAGAPQPSD